MGTGLCFGPLDLAHGVDHRELLAVKLDSLQFSLKNLLYVETILGCKELVGMSYFPSAEAEP